MNNMRGYREHKYIDGVLYLKCVKCNIRKPCSAYHKGKRNIFGFRTECKNCMSERLRIYYESKRDEIAHRNKEYYWENKEKVNNHKKEYYKRTKKQSEYSSNLNKNLGFNWQTFHERTRDYVNKKCMKPEKCCICGNISKIEIHHPSYNSFDDWSKVVFCCHSCHRSIHSGRIKCPEPIELLSNL